MKQVLLINYRIYNFIKQIKTKNLNKKLNFKIKGFITILFYFMS